MSDAEITRLLALARDGEPAKMGAVFEALYPQLLRLANSRMFAGESTVTPTVLVHELFLRISQGSPLALADPNIFCAASPMAWGWIVVAPARGRAPQTRGGDQVMVSLDDRIPDSAAAAMTTALALDKGLQALEAISPQRRQIVELRYFAGMELAEVAALLGISERTVHREWQRARAFLQAMLDDDDGR